MAGVVAQAQMAAAAAQPTAVPLSTAAPASQAEVEELRQMVRELSLRVNVLEAEQRQRRTVAVAYSSSAAPANYAAHVAPTAYAAPVAPAGYAAAVAPANEMASVSASRLSEEVAAIPVAAMPAQAATTAQAPKSESSLLPGELPGGVSLNYTFDGYYGYDFDHPIGRVQYLRAYDVLSNAFSINQAGIVLDQLPDVAGDGVMGSGLICNMGRLRRRCRVIRRMSRGRISTGISSRPLGLMSFLWAADLRWILGSGRVRWGLKGTTRRTR